uniref:Uncharacterized protein n=1 Tax=Arundo donax TaxID=35708 RepID=A0A0A8ZB94_ARUDO
MSFLLVSAVCIPSAIPIKQYVFLSHVQPKISTNLNLADELTRFSKRICNIQLQCASCSDCKTGVKHQKSNESSRHYNQCSRKR